jgi:hypothetical protein
LLFATDGSDSFRRFHGVADQSAAMGSSCVF